MKNALAAMAVLLLLCDASFSARKHRMTGIADNPYGTMTGEVRFKDLPAAHWAAKAVYNLVKLGVTQGYPDGTFRGTKNMTRFETALFLSKLAENMGASALEKFAAEIKSELRTIKDSEEKAHRKIFYLSGRFDLNYYLGDIFAQNTGSLTVPVPRGPGLTYRLGLSGRYDLSPLQTLNFNLDTMDDSLWNGTIFLDRIIDISTTIKADAYFPLELTAGYGPGPKKSSYSISDSIIPSEYEKAYIRPYSGIKISARPGPVSYDLYYYVQNRSTGYYISRPEIDVNRVGMHARLPFDGLFVLGSGEAVISGDYFMANRGTAGSPAATNFKSGIDISSAPLEDIGYRVSARAGSIRQIERSNCAVLADLNIKDLLPGDIDFSVNMAVIGSKYLQDFDAAGNADPLDQWAFAGLDIFDRPMGNGTRILSGSFTKRAAGDITLKIKRAAYLSLDYTSLTRTLTQFDVFCPVSKNTGITAGYRMDWNPASQDLTSDIGIFTFSTKF